MIVTKDLIKKFFENSCTADEAVAVEAYLLEHPEVMEEFIGIEEWNSTEISDNLPNHSFEEMSGEIKRKLIFNPPARVYDRIKMMRWVGVAASLLMVIFSVWMVQKKGFKSSYAGDQAAIQKNSFDSIVNRKGISSTALIEKRNNSGAVQRILLNDGSAVFLDNNSIIKYREYFNDNKREIYLTGAAYFEVAKDKTKPFIVYSGQLSTTALGTSFRVSAFAGIYDNISVKLYTGKVVVKSIGKLNGWDNNIYLLPGEKLVYNKKVVSVTVSRIGDQNNFKTNISGTDANELTFQNSSLEDVIKQLEVKYKVVILFNSKDLEGLNFTGKISNTDSLSVFLNLVAKMNGMYIKEESGSYRIYKSQ